MELHSIDTLSEGWIDDDPHVLIVHVSVKGAYNPQDVIKFATACLEAWGEEVASARLYSVQPDRVPVADHCIIGISCEV
jgi:hypothetical protein